VWGGWDGEWIHVPHSATPRVTAEWSLAHFLNLCIIASERCSVDLRNASDIEETLYSLAAPSTIMVGVLPGLSGMGCHPYTAAASHAAQKQCYHSTCYHFSSLPHCCFSTVQQRRLQHAAHHASLARQYVAHALNALIDYRDEQVVLLLCPGQVQ
jgi:hypothetical protein